MAVACNAFAQVGIQHERWFEHVSEKGIELLHDEGSPRLLTMLLNAYGKLKLNASTARGSGGGTRSSNHGPFLLLLWEHTKGAIAEMPPQSLSMLLQSFTKAASGCEEDAATRMQLLECLADRIATLLAGRQQEKELQDTSMTPLTTSTFAYALHKGQLPDDHAVWSALADVAAVQFHQSTASEVANLAAALGGKQGKMSGKFFQNVRGSLEEQSGVFSTMTFLDLCKIVDGLGRDQVRVPNSLEGGEAASCPNISMRAAHTLIRLLSTQLLKMDKLPLVPYRTLMQGLQRLNMTGLSDDFLQALSQKIQRAKRGKRSF